MKVRAIDEAEIWNQLIDSISYVDKSYAGCHILIIQTIKNVECNFKHTSKISLTPCTENVRINLINSRNQLKKKMMPETRTWQAMIMLFIFFLLWTRLPEKGELSECLRLRPKTV